MRGKKAKGLEEDQKEDRSLTLPKIKVKGVPIRSRAKSAQWKNEFVTSLISLFQMFTS